jgi:hydrogenase maturation protease
MDDNTATRKIVLGLGNILNRDEGLGIHALQALKTRIIQYAYPLSRGEIKLLNHGELEFLDGGVLGLNLLPWVEEASHLLVLDAVNAHKKPGTLVVLERNEIRLFSGIKLSDHQVTFQEVLGLASFRGQLPENMYLIGIQPLDLSVGVGLSPVVAASIPHVVNRAEAILRAWGFLAEPKPEG